MRVAVISAIAGVGLFGAAPVVSQGPLSVIGDHPLPGLSEGTGWINSVPLTSKGLRGKVVLVDFWDYSCINCIRALPYLRAWAERYKDSGLVVIGVHAPEFEVEKQMANVQGAIAKLGIKYPVVLDNNYAIWNTFHNQEWPTEYFIDCKGQVRYQQLGEGGYEESERWIQQLLKEASATPVSEVTTKVQAKGIEAAADMNDVRSPETFVGYGHTGRFTSPGALKHNRDKIYFEPTKLALNDWGLAGQWNDHEQFAWLEVAGGKIVFRFHARDLHLVMGPGTDGKPVRFKVTIDGLAPEQNHGVDTDALGNGLVVEHRLYQLIRQSGPVADYTFAIEFLDPGVQVFSFTFG